MKDIYNEYWEIIDPSGYAAFAVAIFYFWTALL